MIEIKFRESRLNKFIRFLNCVIIVVLMPVWFFLSCIKTTKRIFKTLKLVVNGLIDDELFIKTK